MKNTYRVILFIFVFLLLAGGLALFIMRNSLVGFLEESNGLAVAVPTVKVAADQNNLDLEILKSPRLAALAKNVVNFDFDNICWRPDAKIEPVVASSETATGTPETVTVVNCSKGNNMPFSTKKK